MSGSAIRVSWAERIFVWAYEVLVVCFFSLILVVTGLAVYEMATQ